MATETQVGSPVVEAAVEGLDVTNPKGLTAKQILLRGYAEIHDEENWTTGDWLSHTGRMCALGAVTKAAGLPMQLISEPPKAAPEVLEVLTALATAMDPKETELITSGERFAHAKIVYGRTLTRSAYDLERLQTVVYKFNDSHVHAEVLEMFAKAYRSLFNQKTVC